MSRPPARAARAVVPGPGAAMRVGSTVAISPATSRPGASSPRVPGSPKRGTRKVIAGGPEGDADVPADREEREARGLAISRDLVRGPVALRMVGGDAEARHHDQRRAAPSTRARGPPVRRRWPPAAPPTAGATAGSRDPPGSRRPAGRATRSCSRRAGSRPTRRTRAPKTRLEKREQRRQRALVHVDHEVAQGQEAEHPACSDAPLAPPRRSPAASRRGRARDARRAAVESRDVIVSPACAQPACGRLSPSTPQATLQGNARHFRREARRYHRDSSG